MARLIISRAVIEAAGNKPKRIDVKVGEAVIVNKGEWVQYIHRKKAVLNILRSNYQLSL